MGCYPSRKAPVASSGGRLEARSDIELSPASPCGQIEPMPAATTRTFSFICGQDDFMVGRMGKKRFDELAGDTTDEFSREIVNGFARNVDEVEAAVNRFRESVQTIPMFGGRRVIWLK